MAINYFITRGVNPKKDKTLKYYLARFRQKEVVPYDKVVSDISEQCSAAPADVEAIVRAFFENVVGEVCGGRIVRVGRLGSFRMTLRTGMVAAESDWKTTEVKGANLVFDPGQVLEQELLGDDYKADG